MRCNMRRNIAKSAHLLDSKTGSLPIVFDESGERVDGWRTLFSWKVPSGLRRLQCKAAPAPLNS
jgi:hypothetical protein